MYERFYSICHSSFGRTCKRPITQRMSMQWFTTFDDTMGVRRQAMRTERDRTLKYKHGFLLTGSESDNQNLVESAQKSCSGK